jgi:Na+/proline symporter
MSMTATKNTASKNTATKDRAASRLPDGSKSVQSVWVWRGFFFMSLIALGLAISFHEQGLGFYEVTWGVIAVGWFALSMWLWRKHVRDDDDARAAAQKSGGRAG